MHAGGKSLPLPPPMVPSMLNTFNNKPFMSLLPAWICDNFGMTILTTLITYVVRYTVQVKQPIYIFSQRSSPTSCGTPCR